MEIIQSSFQSSLIEKEGVYYLYYPALRKEIKSKIINDNVNKVVACAIIQLLFFLERSPNKSEYYSINDIYTIGEDDFIFEENEKVTLLDYF